MDDELKESSFASMPKSPLQNSKASSMVVKVNSNSNSNSNSLFLHVS